MSVEVGGDDPSYIPAVCWEVRGKRHAVGSENALPKEAALYLNRER